MLCQINDLYYKIIKILLVMEYKKLTNFKITQKCKKRINEIKKDNENVFIRVMITTGGCAGNQYHILMDDYIGETDYVLIKKYNKKDTIYVVIDEVSLQLLKNSTMDFENSLEFSGFKIDNPNAKAVCNCGNSFNCSGGFVEKKEDCKN